MGNKKILVVDDERDMRIFVSTGYAYFRFNGG
jgi:hypothetical protein